ncbi:MAG: sulfur carrier protein ThiS [Lachnospiraceae bacterium]|nr:sulfur carrier protein ThiS [Lachnospiraceae bacterium]
MVKINGEDVDAAGVVLGKYLDDNGYNRLTIAVERNYEIVTKDKYDDVTIEDGDIIEVVSFVGGG